MRLKYITDSVLAGVALWVAACYAITPLTNDARIYLGVAHIAAEYFPFPASIDLAWEIKPVFNRLVNYFLYKSAVLFVPFDDYFLFGVAVKVLALLCVTAVALYVSRKVSIPYSFYLVFFSFTAIANFCVLQAEYWAALFSVLAVGLMLSRRLTSNFLAGVVMVCVVFLKGITGLLIIPVLCGWFLLETRYDEIDGSVMFSDQLKMFVAGMISAGYAFYASMVLFWPHMVSDMLMSARLAHVGQKPLEMLAVWFVAEGVAAPLYIPVLVIGFVFAGIFFLSWVRHQKLVVRAAYLSMWIVPCVIVIAQGELFSYHYLAFVPSAIVTVLLCERRLA